MCGRRPVMLWTDLFFMNIFKMKNLEFGNISYPDEIIIKENETTFISGRSGSGKSTLFRLMNYSEPASAGEIFFREKPVSSYDPVELRRTVLLVSQEVYLFDGNVRDNFSMYYDYRCQQPPSDSTISEFLKICCTDFTADSNCSVMSGGERQRVFCAICLSMLPEVLLLDEPASALDSATEDIFMDSLISFCRKNSITPVFISHSRKITDKYAESVIYLD